MGYSEKLAARIRRALTRLPDVEEKKMFGGIAFMVNDKMCLTVSNNRMMCRIDPEIYEAALQKEGTSRVIMGRREYKGYVYVSEDSLHARTVFDYWVTLALEFNKKAKPSAKRQKKKRKA